MAAWLFVKYYTSAEVQAAWGLASQYFPVRASSAESLTEYMAENPAYKTAFDLLPYPKAEPAVAGTIRCARKERVRQRHTNAIA